MEILLNQNTNVNELTPETVNSFKSELTLIDVRNDNEFTGPLAHIEGATLVTLGEPLVDYLKANKAELSSQNTVFICRRGGRSTQATHLALELGYTNVFNMIGGMELWNDKNLPTEA